MDSITDIVWGRYVVNKQKLTRSQLNICIETQAKLKEKGVQKSLSEIIFDKRLVDRDTLLRLVNWEGMIPFYQIKRVIGTGGLGIVYQAHSEKMGKDVAIKILNPEYTDNVIILNRFLREVEISKKLDHPNIIKGYDSGRVEDLYYLVLEYIDGLHLAAYVKQFGPMPEEKILDLAFTITNALYYAWSKGLTHRDIKPENLMFTQAGELKVGDFGLAKLSDANASLTISGTIIGTPFFISPEQVKGLANIDYRSDIYSLGATLYYLATGQVMFNEDSMIGICNAHLNAMPYPPSKYARVSNTFDRLILKMVNKSPDDRCKSPKEFLSHLNEICRKNMDNSNFPPDFDEEYQGIGGEDEPFEFLNPDAPSDGIFSEEQMSPVDSMEREGARFSSTALILCPSDSDEELLRTKMTERGFRVISVDAPENPFELFTAHAPELIVVYTYPKEKMDIFEFIGTIQNSRTPDQRIVLSLLESKVDVKTRMQAVLLGIKHHMTKPLTVEAVEQLLEYTDKEQLSRSRHTTRRLQLPALKGTFKTISLPELLQTLQNSAKTGLLTLKGISHQGEIYISGGKIYHCELGALSPKGAFYNMLSWKEGSFSFQELAVIEKEPTLDLEIMGLLLNGMRILDEIAIIKTMMAANHSGEFNRMKLAILEEVVSPEEVKELYAKFSKQAAPQSSFLQFLVEKKIIAANILKQLEEMEQSTDKIKSFSLEKTALLTKGGQIIKDGKKTPPTPKTRSSTPKTSMGTSTGGQQTRIEDAIIQQLILSLNLMNMSQLSECISKQVDMQLQGVYKPLADIISEKGHISSEYIQNLRFFRDDDGQSLFPNYEIVKVLGEGGIAVVYLAREIESNETVAIKIFAPTSSDTSATIARFMREAEAAKKLDHPNIVKAKDFGMLHGVYYLVMEYISGLSLAQIISKVGRFEESKALEILEHLANALTHAWQQNIIHRDIKPSNILSDGDILKICDLGLAKALESEIQLTQEGSIVGTPQFMSPEQFQPEKALDFRTDVYSLGVTFYVMLTGNLPFTATTKIGLAQAHMLQDPPALEKFNIVISKQTKALVHKMMAKDREKRGKEREELLEDIQRVKAGKYPKNTSAGIPKMAVFGGGAAAALLLLVGLVVLLIGKPKSETVKFLQISPDSGSKIYQEETVIQGQVDSNELDAVLVNEKRSELMKLADENKWKFEAKVPLTLGKNQITIVGITKNNTRQTQEYFLWREVLDKTPPVISILEPSGIEPGKTKKFEVNAISMKGYATDEYGVQSIVINEKPAFMMNIDNKAQFQASVQLKEGAQMVKIIAIDKYGNEQEFSFIAMYEPPKKQIRIEVEPDSFTIEAGDAKRIATRLYEGDKLLETSEKDWTWKSEMGDCANGLYKAPSKPGIDFITLSHKQIEKPILIKVQITIPKHKKPVRTTLTKNSKGFYEKTFFNDHLMVWIPFSRRDITPNRENTRRGVWMSKYEISNEQYNKYLQSSGILAHIPLQKSTVMPDNYLMDPEYTDYPVVWVTWKDARDYCNWVKKNLKDELLAVEDMGFNVRLPLMKEVVRSITGRASQSASQYAWGTIAPDEKVPFKANYDATYGMKDKSDPKDGFIFTAPVIHYGGEPYNGGDGQSMFGIYNLSGNVSEWSWDSDPYNKREKIIYGGSWKSRIETLKFDEMSLENRSPDFQMDTIGFRIVFVHE